MTSPTNRRPELLLQLLLPLLLRLLLLPPILSLRRRWPPSHRTFAGVLQYFLNVFWGNTLDCQMSRVAATALEQNQKNIYVEKERAILANKIELVKYVHLHTEQQLAAAWNAIKFKRKNNS